MEAVFGHHGTQDLGDWFGRFGFQPHRTVNGDQIQSKEKERVIVMVRKARNKKAESIKQWIQAGSESNLNKVLFSILSSRELRVRQSWSNTKG